MKVTQLIAELTALVLEHGPEIEVEVRDQNGDLELAGCAWFKRGGWRDRESFFTEQYDEKALRLVIDPTDETEEKADVKRHTQ